MCKPVYLSHRTLIAHMNVFTIISLYFQPLQTFFFPSPLSHTFSSLLLHQHSTNYSVKVQTDDYTCSGFSPHSTKRTAGKSRRMPSCTQLNSALSTTSTGSTLAMAISPLPFESTSVSTSISFSLEPLIAIAMS